MECKNRRSRANEITYGTKTSLNEAISRHDTHAAHSLIATRELLIARRALEITVEQSFAIYCILFVCFFFLKIKHVTIFREILENEICENENRNFRKSYNLQDSYVYLKMKYWY